MSHQYVYFSLFFLLLITLGLGFVRPFETMAVMNSASYEIWADTFSSGGTEGQSSASYQLSETIGESIINSATSTSANFGIKSGFRELYRDPSLTFSLGSTSVDLGTLSASQTNSASHTMSVTSNHVNGVIITVSGSTLTSGANTITAIGATAAAASVGSEQFGINLVDNATPDVGADASGTAPIATAVGAYETADQFAYQSGDTIATSTSQINQTTLTVSYMANIAAGTEAGTYTNTLTYTATGGL